MLFVLIIEFQLPHARENGYRIAGGGLEYMSGIGNL